MAAHQRDSGVSVSSFFARCKLPSNTRDDCDIFAKTHFPSEESRPVPFQGYCSYTMIVGRDRIVQFRPAGHGLDVDIIAAARRIFGGIVPETKFLGALEDSDLRVYAMTKLEGVSLSDLRLSSSPGRTRSLRRHVVQDFARIQATSWLHRRSENQVSAKRLVGSSLRWRIDAIMANIPEKFKRFVYIAHQSLQDIENLPWVMSHGDFIPANVLVCPNTGRVKGLLDWAEAEWLPFGVGMYGLEELLGEEVDGRFKYHTEARELRVLFWKCLSSLVPELSRDLRFSENVKRAQLLGILFWHAIAFDDGKLDRVVEEGVDDGEIQRLEAFLLSSSGPPYMRTRRNLGEKWRFSYNHVRKFMVGEK
ncbi:hypothetical protein BKA67DRAFT_535597 [Truncatella angustata]|uniref:Aminoglycoside phosphotransferase domain-containing protein n=1 Tax=Truncatella angustata TaxID=152316 RepID=A0A9P8UL46_9PEZI|nr:uncharacterized protein BKA67DRAFT_535597 [Truncatella angustata]KAH6654267.1 hypothetical protein BKA67DRAFT_535597 [Truncatella angustata]